MFDLQEKSQQLRIGDCVLYKMHAHDRGTIATIVHIKNSGIGTICIIKGPQGQTVDVLPSKLSKIPQN